MIESCAPGLWGLWETPQAFSKDLRETRSVFRRSGRIHRSARAAEELAIELAARGLDVLYDDRDERPGVKFKDAELIGIPLRVVVGGKSLAAGQIEISLRRDRQKILVPVADGVAKALELVAAERG